MTPRQLNENFFKRLRGCARWLLPTLVIGPNATAVLAVFLFLFVSPTWAVFFGASVTLIGALMIASTVIILLIQCSIE